MPVGREMDPAAFSNTRVSNRTFASILPRLLVKFCVHETIHVDGLSEFSGERERVPRLYGFYIGKHEASQMV